LDGASAADITDDIHVCSGNGIINIDWSCAYDNQLRICWANHMDASVKSIATDSRSSHSSTRC
jgi:hypothetical protein